MDNYHIRDASSLLPNLASSTASTEKPTTSANATLDP